MVVASHPRIHPYSLIRLFKEPSLSLVLQVVQFSQVPRCRSVWIELVYGAFLAMAEIGMHGLHTMGGARCVKCTAVRRISRAQLQSVLAKMLITPSLRNTGLNHQLSCFNELSKLLSLSQ